MTPPEVSYKTVRESNPPYEDTKAYLDSRISKMVGEDEKLRSALDLVIVLAPEEVEQQMEDLVRTPIAYLIGATAAFWVVQRVVGFWA